MDDLRSATAMALLNSQPVKERVAQLEALYKLGAAAVEERRASRAAKASAEPNSVAELNEVNRKWSAYCQAATNLARAVAVYAATQGVGGSSTKPTPPPQEVE